MLTSPNAGVGWKKIHESAIIFCWKHFVAMGNEGRRVLDFFLFFFFWFCSLFFSSSAFSFVFDHTLSLWLPRDSFCRSRGGWRARREVEKAKGVVERL